MSQNNPLVSICIPAYNHEKYVQSCIQSVIDQDYDNIELIVIDDGSKDNTWAKIQEMASLCRKRFNRFIALQQENQGAAAASYKMRNIARGEFRGGIASDDQYLPGAITALIKPMLEDERIGLVVGVNEIMDSDGKTCYWDQHRHIVFDRRAAAYTTFDQYLMNDSKVDFYSDRFGSYQELIQSNHIPNGTLCRSGKFALPLPQSRGRVLEDWWFHLQFCKVVKYKAVPQHTFRYRWHSDNTIQKPSYISEAYLNTLLAERNLLLCNDELIKFRDVAADKLRFFDIKKRIIGPVKLLVEHRLMYDIIEIGTVKYHVPMWRIRVDPNKGELT